MRTGYSERSIKYLWPNKIQLSLNKKDAESKQLAKTRKQKKLWQKKKVILTNKIGLALFVKGLGKRAK